MDNNKRWYYAMSLFVLLIITICILKVSECSRKNLERKLLAERQLAIRNFSSLRKDSSFDILIFTQHWPYTVCAQWMEQHKGNECMLPRIKNAWTVHGIWPTKYHTIGPLYCNDSWIFDPDAIMSIEDEMKEKWINIEKNTPLESLWKHEWEKHGTCAAAQMPDLSSQLKYFKEGLNLIDRFSVTKLLMPTYIKPGIDISYKVEEIHSALNLSIGNNFAIVCEKDHKTKQQFLFEIRMCFDKELNIHSCDGIVMADGFVDVEPDDEIITNCRRDQDIAYPSSAWLLQRQWMAKVKEQQSQSSSWRSNVVNFYKLVRLIQWYTL